jgi:DNA-directed RNA polymerase subunit L
MKVNLIKKDKDYIEFQLEGASETMLIPLRNQLLTDESVEFANYNIRHPRLDTPIFYVGVSSGKPQNAMKKATKSLSNQFKEMLTQIQKA